MGGFGAKVAGRVGFSNEPSDTCREEQMNDPSGLDELKSMVTTSLAAKGVLASLRAQLRAAVYEALDEADGGAGGSSGAALVATCEDHVLLLSLVADYLHSAGLKYSASVLIAEAGIDARPDPLPRAAALAAALDLPHPQGQEPVLATLIRTAKALPASLQSAQPESHSRDQSPPRAADSHSSPAPSSPKAASSPATAYMPTYGSNSSFVESFDESIPESVPEEVEEMLDTSLVESIDDDDDGGDVLDLLPQGRPTLSYGSRPVAGAGLNSRPRPTTQSSVVMFGDDDSFTESVPEEELIEEETPAAVPALAAAMTPPAHRGGAVASGGLFGSGGGGLGDAPPLGRPASSHGRSGLPPLGGRLPTLDSNARDQMARDLLGDDFEGDSIDVGDETDDDMAHLAYLNSLETQLRKPVVRGAPGAKTQAKASVVTANPYLHDAFESDDDDGGMFGGRDLDDDDDDFDDDFDDSDLDAPIVDPHRNDFGSLATSDRSASPLDVRDFDYVESVL
ncbi:uncharacterized protein AMSG_06854 [Thecamonas trahens ATCC 50062]|uniref:Uncharacterized protein n=1 Tax=Thecamonas trahens ATCC 50062 TaxID=461836 RepID=A0A0L0DDD8_THETB|nr:hypothetical protein AMSG_06854 [Thecamonas trahens ATCC 50062]KNC50367.1 hypothetical protein AMSG_06854 [Thecamonas trahens ATCC 50062]|eukprot:XP_013756909.1 hypothetical protein AMSG_06854 [Thecamonas trahens ATCC 50062]